MKIPSSDKSLGEKAHSSRAAAAQINAKYSVF